MLAGMVMFIYMGLMQQIKWMNKLTKCPLLYHSKISDTNTNITWSIDCKVYSFYQNVIDLHSYKV